MASLPFLRIVREKADVIDWRMSCMGRSDRDSAKGDVRMEALGNVEVENRREEERRVDHRDRGAASKEGLRDGDSGDEGVG